MLYQTCSRRKFVRSYLYSACAVAGIGSLTSGCGSETTSRKESKKTTPATPTDPCTDLSALSETDRQARKKLGYVNESPIADSKCGNCQLWLPPKDGKACGGCQLFKGPVYATAYCTYWAPQNEG